jgi:hypothetical protein
VKALEKLDNDYICITLDDDDDREVYLYRPRVEGGGLGAVRKHVSKMPIFGYEGKRGSVTEECFYTHRYTYLRTFHSFVHEDCCCSCAKEWDIPEGIALKLTLKSRIIGEEWEEMLRNMCVL